MLARRLAFAFVLILSIIPALGVGLPLVSSQGYVTTQVTTTALYTYAIATQYATSTSYVYQPTTFTIQGTSAGCTDRWWQSRAEVESFNGTQGEQFHMQWTVTDQKSGAQTSVGFFITTLSEFVNTWWCNSSGTQKVLWAAHYSSSSSDTWADWVAPATGEYVALIVNNNPNAVSGTLSIETLSINTVPSISYRTASTLLVALTTESFQPGLLAFFGNFGTVGYVILVGAVALSGSFLLLMKRRKASQPALRVKSTAPLLKAQPMEKATPPPPRPPPPMPTPTAEVIKPVTEKPPKVSPPVGPISTGYLELDQMLSGGLPEHFAVLFASPSYDERDLLLSRIIESNLSTRSISFYVSSDVRKMVDLLGRYKDNFYAFCSQADKASPGQVNLFNVGSVENLSDFNISLNTSLRRIPVEQGARKIMIIDVLSDVLLHHKLPMTRRWLADFLTKRKADGFTVLATFNPLIAAREEAQTIMDSFDGVIEIYEKELKERSRRFLTIKKMYGLRYSETELMLDKNKLY